jgi:hypothetical protein
MSNKFIDEIQNKIILLRKKKEEENKYQDKKTEWTIQDGSGTLESDAVVSSFGIGDGNRIFFKTITIKIKTIEK